ncbi:GlsB/YeaQ/YmgE family stress response membrane protein [Candidatus Aalborgicola defluviihabitans]|uniref:GlsB/YeaQ/YmgE family stress response membrane protein n=1 Tax=Candidatus Aalborgicola defluviihabitans TaxID=3386187 RepID=UPI001DB66F74|nr:GlsB/YeaQ/YmgE family stress response membrane protein [Burkholderiales bacterium]MBK7280950.1 GlsB/YeaQ/YmgE family stress response membrane protein [Burkholderiales bacterium]MBK7315772.1 GlsB/YeaQ/YmgE family stress response membrane protein [Burkholderiales bacterium]MBL0243203.1 GlsB/YeaQ/YmgE family stress response membrane protein [Rhodoferax sp.]
MQYVWMAIIGFIVGLVARALLPGDQKIGMIMTAVLGIAGSFIANYGGQALGWYKVGEGAGFIASVVGAIVLLVVYGMVTKASGARS